MLALTSVEQGYQQDLLSLSHLSLTQPCHIDGADAYIEVECAGQLNIASQGQK